MLMHVGANASKAGSSWLRRVPCGQTGAFSYPLSRASAWWLAIGPPQERRTSSSTGRLAAIQGRALHCTGREAGDLRRHSIPCHSRHNA